MSARPRIELEPHHLQRMKFFGLTVTGWEEAGNGKRYVIKDVTSENDKWLQLNHLNVVLKSNVEWPEIGTYVSFVGTVVKYTRENGTQDWGVDLVEDFQVVKTAEELNITSMIDSDDKHALLQYGFVELLDKAMEQHGVQISQIFRVPKQGHLVAQIVKKTRRDEFVRDEQVRKLLPVLNQYIKKEKGKQEMATTVIEAGESAGKQIKNLISGQSKTPLFDEISSELQKILNGRIVTPTGLGKVLGFNSKQWQLANHLLEGTRPDEDISQRTFKKWKEKLSFVPGFVDAQETVLKLQNEFVEMLDKSDSTPEFLNENPSAKLPYYRARAAEGKLVVYKYAQYIDAFKEFVSEQTTTETIASTTEISIADLMREVDIDLTAPFEDAASYLEAYATKQMENAKGTEKMIIAGIKAAANLLKGAPANAFN